MNDTDILKQFEAKTDAEKRHTLYIAGAFQALFDSHNKVLDANPDKDETFVVYAIVHDMAILKELNPSSRHDRYAAAYMRHSTKEWVWGDWRWHTISAAMLAAACIRNGQDEEYVKAGCRIFGIQEHAGPGRTRPDATERDSNAKES